MNPRQKNGVHSDAMAVPRVQVPTVGSGDIDAKLAHVMNLVGVPLGIGTRVREQNNFPDARQLGGRARKQGEARVARKPIAAHDAMRAGIARADGWDMNSRDQPRDCPSADQLGGRLAKQGPH